MFFLFLDAEPQDVEQRTVRFIPDSVDRLAEKTKFSRQELKSMYRNFKNVSSPSVTKQNINWRLKF